MNYLADNSFGQICKNKSYGCIMPFYHCKNAQIILLIGSLYEFSGIDFEKQKLP